MEKTLRSTNVLIIAVVELQVLACVLLMLFGTESLLRNDGADDELS